MPRYYPPQRRIRRRVPRSPVDTRALLRRTGLRHRPQNLCPLPPTSRPPRRRLTTSLFISPVWAGSRARPISLSEYERLQGISNTFLAFYFLIGVDYFDRFMRPSSQ